jgi:hypothetical protein
VSVPEPVDELPITTGDDVVRVRQAVRARAGAARLSLVDQTKLITSASEPARNTLVHGGSGVARVETVQRDGRPGAKEVCGDAHGTRSNGRGFSLVVADGSGHGPLAASASSAAVRTFLVVLDKSRFSAVLLPHVVADAARLVGRRS